MRFVIGALLGLSAASMGFTLARAPIVNGATFADVEGARRGEAARLLFEPAPFASYMARRALGAGNGAGAAIWARRGIARAPHDAYLHLSLAWGEALAGEDEAARAALLRSYELAPRSIALAQSRAALAQKWWPTMAQDERMRLLEEIRVARGFDAAAFNRIAERTPRLRALHDLSASLPLTAR